MKILLNSILAISIAACTTFHMSAHQHRSLNTLGVLGSGASILSWAPHPRIIIDTVHVALGLSKDPENTAPESKKRAIVWNTLGAAGAVGSMLYWWPQVAKEIHEKGLIRATDSTYTLRILIDLIQTVVCVQRIQAL